MAGIFLAEGMAEFMKFITGTGGLGTAGLRLFVNNFTPAVGDSLGSFTECADSGYAEAVLNPAIWNPSGGSGEPQVMTYPVQTFGPIVGTDTIYGCYVVDQATNKVVFAQLATVPITVTLGGVLVDVTLIWNLANAP